MEEITPTQILLWKQDSLTSHMTLLAQWIQQEWGITNFLWIVA